jgi:polyhydroxybutyrate depolymerase
MRPKIEDEDEDEHESTYPLCAMPDQVIYLRSGNLDRRYVVHVPPTSSVPAPVVIMLDGRGGTPWTAMKSTGWSRKADAAGFLAVYPEATRLDPEGPLHFLDNPQMWNAGAGGSDAARSEVDDVAFLRGAIRDLSARFPVDARQIFMAGFSNGASMTMRFALEAPGILAAIAPVAGYLRNAAGALEEPVPAIFFYGKTDPLAPYRGGDVGLPWGKVEWRPPVMDTVAAWARLMGIDPEPERSEESHGVTSLHYGVPESPREIASLAVEDLGHVWPGGHRLLPEKLVGQGSDRVNATDLIWEFFRRHPKV